MNTDETERDGAYDRVCRDPRDNCPTDGAVLQREWRQKTATIAMLGKMVEQQGEAGTEMKSALTALYFALRDSAPKLSPAAAEAFGKARDVLARYGS